MGGTPRARTGRRTLTALGGSVALHVLLLALLLSREVPPRPAPPIPIEVELRSVVGAARAGETERRPEAAFGGPAPGARTGPVATARPSAVPPVGPSPSPDRLRGTPLQGLLVRPHGAPPDLSVHIPEPGEEEPGVAVSPADERGPNAPPGEALTSWLREQAGRDRVANGVVHPYYRDLGRALLGAWDAERAVRRRGLSGFLAQAGENVVTFARVWQRLAEGYAKTGAPSLLDGDSARVRELSALPPGPARDALLALEIQRQLRAAFTEGRTAQVRVTQAADGRLLSVELVAPSRNEEIDRAAIADVRAAASKLPAPPAEALAGRETLVSLWEFELQISITPPLPVVSVEFDEVLGLTDVRVPLDRRVWKRVRLVAVL